MGVSVEGKGHGGVPQEILNELGMVAPGEQQRRARVLEVVEAYIRGSPASLRSGLNEVRTTLRESSGRPPWVAKTSPWSSQRLPDFRRSVFWAALWADLQIYWIMASSDSKSRCEHCGRIISLGRPHPDGRKRRRDKRFCDDACRQACHRSKQVS